MAKRQTIQKQKCHQNFDRGGDKTHTVWSTLGSHEYYQLWISIMPIFHLSSNEWFPMSVQHSSFWHDPLTGSTRPRYVGHLKGEIPPVMQVHELPLEFLQLNIIQDSLVC